MNSDKLDILLVGEEDYIRPSPDDRSAAGLLRSLLLTLGGSFDTVTPPRMGKVLLATYAAAAGYSAAVEDNVLAFPFGLRRFRRQLRRAPLAVGISTVAIRYPGTVERIVAEVRRYSPGSKIIMGGQGVWYHTGLRRLADLTVTGYGEHALLRVMETLRAGARLEALPGVQRDAEGLLLRGEDFYGPEKPRFPDWRFYRGRSRRLALEASRGCRYNCSFCTLRSQRRQVFRDPDEVLAEMARDVREYGAERVDFVDSTFTGDAAFIGPFLDKLGASGLKVPWGCLSRIDDFARQPDLPGRMARAGCVYCCIGLESVDDEVLRRMRKGYNRKVVEAGLSRLEGLYVQLNLIIGFPGDTREKVAELVEFVRRYPVRDVVVTPLFVPPTLFEEARRDPELFCNLRGEAADAWTHDTMSAPEAAELAAWAYREMKKFLPGA